MEKGSGNKDFFHRHLAGTVAGVVGRGLREGVFPGAVAAIGHGVPGRRRLFIRAYGQAALVPSPRPLGEETFFDLASLTKPLVTSLAVLCLIERGLLSLDMPLPRLVEDTVPEEKKTITLARLLGHSSGLPAHRPYFEALRSVPAPERGARLVELILREPLEYRPGSMTVYSDLGFMLLGRIVELKGGMGLATLAHRWLFEPLGLGEHLFFRPLHDLARETAGPAGFAATENCGWRGRILCGEVHDDNAFVLGGVAGHAGLFGDAGGVLALTLALLDQWQGRATHPGYANRDLARLLGRQDIASTSWGLGFDTPSEGYSSGGRLLSRHSVGHLGFTGTSFWIDPEKETVVVLLTNRVHPDRHREGMRAFRPLFHDAVLAAIAQADPMGEGMVE